MHGPSLAEDTCALGQVKKQTPCRCLEQSCFIIGDGCTWGRVTSGGYLEGNLRQDPALVPLFAARLLTLGLNAAARNDPCCDIWSCAV